MRDRRLRVMWLGGSVLWGGLSCSVLEDAGPGAALQADTAPESVASHVPPSPPTTVGAVQCTADADCRLDLNPWTTPQFTRQLIGSRCTHLTASPIPVCQCAVRIASRLDPDREPFEGSFYLGQRTLSNGCDVVGRPQTCLYCASEFTGCHMDDVDSCAAVCEQAITRQEAEFAEPIPIVERASICTESSQCLHLWQLNDKCYVGDPNTRWLAPLDCTQPDKVLLAAVSEQPPSSMAGTEQMGGDRSLLPGSSLSTFSPCKPEAPIPCQTAEDCPAAMACNDGVCGACADRCSYPVGQPELAVCEGDARCAAGELCAMGLCVPEERLACRFATECAAESTCVLSGVDSGTARGNTAMRSYCRSNAEGCPEPVFDEAGNRLMIEGPPGCP